MKKKSGVAVPGFPSLHKIPADPRQSPYYVDPTAMTPLQKHCAYFDRNGDGIVWPWETWAGFRALGYNFILTFIGTLVIHLFFSYWTLDTWLPDPLLPILIKNVDRLKHGSDSEVYEHDGTLKPVQGDVVMCMLKDYGEEGSGGLGVGDLVRMTQHKWDVMDVFGWWAGKLEWFYLWVLTQQRGVIPWEAVRKQYDGSLFHEIEHLRKQKQP